MKQTPKSFSIPVRDEKHCRAVLAYLDNLGYIPHSIHGTPEKFRDEFASVIKEVVVSNGRYGGNYSIYGWQTPLALADVPEFKCGPQPGERPETLKVGRLYRIRGKIKLFRLKCIVGTDSFQGGAVCSMSHHKGTPIYVHESDLRLASPDEVTAYLAEA